jgi:hypothetical protein
MLSIWARAGSQRNWAGLLFVPWDLWARGAEKAPDWGGESG